MRISPSLMALPLIVPLALFAAMAIRGAQNPEQSVAIKPDTSFAADRTPAFTPSGSQQGGFTILVPRGWKMNQVPGAPLAAVISPPGQHAPAVYLALFAVSDIRYNAMLNRCTGQFNRNPLLAPNMISGCVAPAVRAQLADSARQWKAEQALGAILQMFSGPADRFQITSSNETSPGQVQYRVASVENGEPLSHWGEVSMSYLANPLLSQAGQAGVTSLALVTGCRSAPDSESALRATCASVLQSFRPVPNWSQAVAAEFMQSYRQEAQALINMGINVANNMGVTREMIGNFGAAQQQMQLQTFENIQGAQYRSQQNWNAALGGNVNMVNPVTGEVKSLPSGYGSYCDDAAGNTVAGSDVGPGKSVGHSLPCATMLQQW
jgi:hypothetical protein